MTISDVAALAGVSPSTVSRVMNERFAGKPEIAERVRAAAAELSYSPSPVARGLALGETKVIALVVPDLTNPAFLAVLSGVCRAAAEDGYRVMVADTAESAEEEALLSVETRRRCDSLILCAPRMSEERLSEIVPGLYPVVMINRELPFSSVPSLSFDYGAGIEHLAEHLYGFGHRRIAFLSGPAQSASNHFRLAGLGRFAERHADVELTYIESGVSSDAGRDAADAVVDAEVTAVLAYNDLVAVGLLQALAERKLRVPQDISVAGFDDIPMASYTSPALTTIAVPHAQLGREAWARLKGLIGASSPDYRVVFEARLVVRGSTGPVSSRTS